MVTTLEDRDSPEDSEVGRSELDIMSCVEGPRHAPVREGLHHHGRWSFRLSPVVVISYSSGPNRL